MFVAEADFGLFLRGGDGVLKKSGRQRGNGCR